MLHKSFKPAKCQTALKLASSRIKLLKNKRDAQVKQLKRELAQLLESGQDQTARIRVEHVVREEKTMAAYELIEIYCELIVARLPIIESQKNCPIDLKEAISSVIFASPRCADIPELMDVRKHFTAKYGKDFVSAAVELRPDCGVSRLLVEKLSAKAPDGPTKVKILSVIAEEHNIKWDPKSFEEKNNPPVDLLNGPNTFGQPSNSADKVPPNFEVTSQHHEKHDAPTSTFGPRTTYQNLRDRGSREMEVRYPENREAGSFSMGKQAFKMEFADATAAAQAAAESAERASMAARAAAELSSRGSTQQSMEKQNHPAFMSQDDWIQSDLNPRLPSEYNGKHPANDFFDKRDSGKHHHELSDAELTERFYKLKNSNTSHQRIPSKPSGSPVDEHSTDDEDGSSSSRQCIDSERKSEGRFEYEKKSDCAAYFEEDLRQPSKDFSPDSFGHNHEDSMPSQFKPQNKDEDASELESPIITHEGETQRSSRDSNSQANATAVFDDSGSDNELINLDGEENFRDSNYLSSEGGIPSSDFLGSSNIWSPRQKAAISSGKSDSHSPFVLEQQSSSSDLLGSANIWSRRQKAATLVLEQQPDTISKIVTSDTVTVEPDSSEAIVFDESDGENDLNKVTPGEKESSGDESRVKAKEYVGYNRQTELDHSSDDSEVEIHSQRDSRTEVHYGKTLDSRSGHKSQISQPFNSEDFDKREKKTQISSDNYEPDTKYVRDSSSEAGNELNLGSLKGGLRNKGYKHPPYRRDASNLASTKRVQQDASNRIEQSSSFASTKRVQEDASNRIEQSSSVRKSEISSGVHDQGPDHQCLQKETREAHSTSAATYIDPNDEDSEDELQKRPSRTAQELFNRRASNDMNNKPYARTYFDSEKSESEEDMMTPTLTTKHRPGTGVSRRTKASSLDSNRNKATSMQFETTRTTEKGVERKSSSQSAYTSGSRHESQSQINNLNQWGNRERSQSSEQAASKKYPFPEESPRSISSSEKHGTESESKLDYRGRSAQPSLGDTGSYRRVMESKSSSSGKKLESSTRKSTSNPPASIVASSGSAESLKTPSRVNSHDQASHVHPKLPDYDTLSAHLLSLRRNQQ